MLWLIVFVLVLFRWPILQRFLGTKRMHLFDALMYTVFAAMNFAQPSPWPMLGYGVGCLCILWAYGAGKRFLNFEVANEQGKSDAGTTKGS